MRSAILLLGRICARRAYTQIPPRIPRGSGTKQFEFSRLYTACRPRPSTLPSVAGRIGRGSAHFNGNVLKAAVAAGGALGTVAFVKLSETDNAGTKQTAEGRMLEVSRGELKKEVDDSETGLARLGHQIFVFVDVYLWEPLCTGVRFLHLVVIFVPVILAVPIIWIGGRQPNRDNERSGTLWWYAFLVKSMELAGPAFIKVQRPLNPRIPEPLFIE